MFQRIFLHRFSRNFANFTRNQSNVSAKLKENQFPIFGGITVIGIFHYFRIRRQQNKELQVALESGKLEKIKEDVSWKISFYNSLPLDILSQLMGDLSRKKIPEFARKPIFNSYCKFYEVNIDEALESDVKQYKTLSEFFRRKLKPGTRKIDEISEIVAPCDGKVLHCGVISDENQVEQVKGMTYSLEEFLGRSNIPLKTEVITYYV